MNKHRNNFMYKEYKKKKWYPDLTRTKSAERSVGAQLEPLIQNITKYNLREIKNRMINIIDAPDTIISKEKAYEYKTALARIYSLEIMYSFVTNIYCSAAKMSLKLKK
jgi:hypothetical protein